MILKRINIIALDILAEMFSHCANFSILELVILRSLSYNRTNLKVVVKNYLMGILQRFARVDYAMSIL